MSRVGGFIILAAVVSIFLLGVWGMMTTLTMLPEIFDGTPTPTATRVSAPTSTSIPPATPSSTATATSTPTVTATSTLVPERVRVTWYGEAFRGGPLYCGTDIYGRYDPDNPTTIAMGADGPPCGSKLLLCSESVCIRAVIKDKCEGCGPGHLDLSRAAWDDLGHPSAVDMTILAPSPPEK